MFGSSSKPAQPAPTTFNERLNEQLINCLNVQTNVIQNLAQYSQHISVQLSEIKSVVEILSNRVLVLQQQQQQQQSHFPPSHYAASYYPNYMPPPQIPVSHPPPPPMPHPPPPMSHPPPPPPASMPFSTPQSASMRMPSMTAPTTNANPLFFNAPASTNPPLSVPTSAPTFTFSSSSSAQPPSQSTMSSAVPATTATPTKSLFGGTPAFTMADNTSKPPATFPVTTTKTSATTGEKPSNNSPFSFGVGNLASVFGAGNFPSATSTMSTIKPETHAAADDDGGEGGDEDDSYEPNVSFKPIVQLSAVETKTGEEDENVLFCERAKLYRFDSATNQMKERGVGEMKILQHKTTKVCRVLMRREQVLKLCANHQITSQMELKPHQGTSNAYLWSAMDFADGEPKHETLCVRFKTEEQAKSFAKVFNEAKEGNAKKTGGASSTGKTSSTEATTTTTNDDDVISLGEVKPSAEQIDRAKQLQLPSTFFLYENKEPCKGCPGCKEDTPPTTAHENKTKTTTITSNPTKNDTKSTNPQTPSTAPTAKTPLGSSENTIFSFGNADKSQKPTSTNKDDKSLADSSSTSSTVTSQYDAKPSIFGGFNGTSSVFGNSPSSSSTIFGASPSIKPAETSTGGFSFPGFGGAPGASTGGFQFSTPASTSTTTPATSGTDAKPTFTFGGSSTATTNSNSTFSFGSTNSTVFGNAPKFSFSDLAKQTPTTKSDEKPTTNGTDQRVFAGQGSLVFGTPSANTTATGNHHDDDEGGDGGGEDDSYEPNVSFKPIVQLSAVETKTGEEDEDVLFCERAKLYRFDSATNQMKERGVGEIKILRHKSKKHCRIVMRREQVLKLCANHQITSQMELKPHQGTENAYVWSAMDFADGEAKHETLCVRFKSADAAKRFVQQFNDAKQAAANEHQ